MKMLVQSDPNMTLAHKKSDTQVIDIKFEYICGFAALISKHIFISERHLWSLTKIQKSEILLTNPQPT